MLREDDIARFRELFRQATVTTGVSPVDPATALKTEKGLFPEEIWQLAQSLQIAAVLGDADRHEAIAADVIARQVPDIHCVDLDQSAEWQQAIAWAVTQLSMDDVNAPRAFTDRSEQVGQACRRLRKQGYQLSVNAYGVVVSDKSQREIAARIDGLVAHLGGAEVAMQVCRVIDDNKQIYDGMWLLGDRVPGI